MNQDYKEHGWICLGCDEFLTNHIRDPEGIKMQHLKNPRYNCEASDIVEGVLNHDGTVEEI